MKGFLFYLLNIEYLLYNEGNELEVILLRTWIKRISLILLSLIVVTLLIFYTPDLSQEQLELTYTTPNSHFVTLTIHSLDQTPLPIDVHYQEFGRNNEATILLLHGAFSSSHTFIPWAETLEEIGYRVLLLDLPYFGLTKGFEDEVTSLRRSSEVVKALLTHLEVDSIHIGGNSLGGGVAWYFASNYPDMTASLLLINSIAPSITDQRRDNISPILQTTIASSVISQFTPKFLVNPILASAYGNKSNLTKPTLNRYFDLLRREQTRSWILRVKSENIPNEDLDAMISSISSPTLLMWGELDSWIPVSTVSIFQAKLSLDQSAIIIYPDLGHVPMEENPDTVVDYETFLEQITP